MKPIIVSSFEWPEGVKHPFEFYDISEPELPNLPWQQVYAVCNLDNRVILPVYQPNIDEKSTRTNLIGGHTEPGESLEETLRREILEETNCEVLEWHPLGYQKVWGASDEVIYQARVYAKVRRLGKFEKDPGGTIVDHKLVNLDEINKYLGWGEVGEFLVEKCSRYFGEHND